MKANSFSRPRSITIELTRGGPTQEKKIGKQKSDIQVSPRETVTIQVTKSPRLNRANGTNSHG